MKPQQLLILIAIVFLSASTSFGQSWIESWQHETNFYTIQKAFNAYCKEHEKDALEDINLEDDDEGIFAGYIQFKRWEAFVQPRVYPSGDLSLLGSTWKNYQEFLNHNKSAMRTNTSKQIQSQTWTAKGPFGPLTGNATNGLPRKAGRINFITFDPSDSLTFWVGAPAGGLWKTTDGGTTWTTLTDNLAIIGCTDLAIDPTNHNIMYLATGDGYFPQRNPSSIGVLKSVNGGISWDTTGLVFTLSQNYAMRHIIINPLNPQIIIASTSNGIYRSTNGGVGAWAHVNTFSTYDLEFKPSNPDTVYAGGLTFRRSVNGGASFTQLSNGIPTSGSLRMEVATTIANPNVVYVASSNSNAALQGIYRSLDAGTTFTLMASTPNIIGNDCVTNNSASGQGWYDLAFDASPLNQNELVLGALAAWHSLDGGATWTMIGCGYSFTNNPPYVHTDHQEFEYTPTGTLYDVNDGGIFKYTGTQWNDLSYPMNIAQIYKIGLSNLSPDLWITGHQDNGSNIYHNGTYSASLAADGTSCFIDRTNDQNMFTSISQGNFYKSTNGGGAWAQCTTGISGVTAFVTPWKQDPQVATTLYAGRDQMYRSVNSAGNWTATPGVMQGTISTEYITEFAIAPSNNQYLYAIHGNTGIRTTTDAAATNWITNNTGLPTTLASATSVIVNPTNPSEAWVTFSGFSSGNKVFRTTTGGTSWQNISYNLPNIPANCLVYQPSSSNGRIYVGMEVGVYYIDSLSNAWTLFNTGLPNTPVNDLKISPAAPNTLIAATFGRGVYEIDLGPTTGTIANSTGTILFNIFPNPTHDLVTITINIDQETNFQIELTNILGSHILNQTKTFSANKTEQQIDLSSLPNGIYFLKISSKEGTSQPIKIIKE